MSEEKKWTVKGGMPAHVFGRVADSAKYESLHPRFAQAFAFMRRPDLAQLPCGRYEIDGKNCWAMVQEAKLKPFDEVNTYEGVTPQFLTDAYNAAVAALDSRDPEVIGNAMQELNNKYNVVLAAGTDMANFEATVEI